MAQIRSRRKASKASTVPTGEGRTLDQLLADAGVGNGTVPQGIMAEIQKERVKVQMDRIKQRIIDVLNQHAQLTQTDVSVVREARKAERHSLNQIHSRQRAVDFLNTSGNVFPLWHQISPGRCQEFLTSLGLWEEGVESKNQPAIQMPA